MADTENGPQLMRLGTLKVFVSLEPSDGGPAAGTIVIPRRDAARPNVYATIYEALRSRMEIMRRYGAHRSGAGAELDQLSALRGDLRETHVDLLAGETAGADETFAAAAVSLKRKRNSFKKGARVKAEAGVVRHPTETVNRGATRARLAAIDRRIALREDEVRSIAPWIGAMETALMLEVRRSESVVKDLDRTAQSMLRHEFVRKGATSDGQRKALAARLRLMQDPLGTLVARPFLDVKKVLAAPVLRAILAAEKGTVDDFSDALCAIIAPTGTCVARSVIEAVLTLSAAGLPAGQLYKAADRASRTTARTLRDAGVPIKVTDLIAAAMRLACTAIKEGHPDAAKPWLKEAIQTINPA